MGRSEKGLSLRTLKPLRALNIIQYQFVYVLGYYTPSDGGGGLYYFDPADMGTHNSGTIISPDHINSDKEPGRWRLFHHNRLDVRQFGATGEDEMFLFSTELNFQTELEQPFSSVSVRKKFEDHGISLSDNATISIKVANSRWRIVDTDQDNKIYSVIKEDEMLNIYDQNDGTQAIQNLLDSLTEGGTAVFSPGTYMIDATVSLKPLSNTHIVLMAGCIVKAIPNGSDDAQIFNLNQIHNIIIEGQGTIQGDRETHLNITGEGGHGILAKSCQNLIIRDITCRDCWGDGIYLGQESTSDPLTPLPERSFRECKMHRQQT